MEIPFRISVFFLKTLFSKIINGKTSFEYIIVLIPTCGIIWLNFSKTKGFTLGGPDLPPLNLQTRMATRKSGCNITQFNKN